MVRDSCAKRGMYLLLMLKWSGEELTWRCIVVKLKYYDVWSECGVWSGCGNSFALCGT